MNTWQIIAFSLSWIWIIFTLLPFIKRPWWWVRVLDYPRIQILILGLVTALFYLIVFYPFQVKEIGFLVVMLAVLSIQFYQVFPFLIFHKKESKRIKNTDQSRMIHLMISNVRMKNKEYLKLLTEVDVVEPDVLLVVETNQWWEEHLHNLEQKFPYQIKHPLENTYGMLLYSKLELVEPRKNFYLSDGIPSFITGLKLPSGDVIRLYCVHPEPPRLMQDTDERDAEILIAGKEIKEKKEPAIIIGDLNDVGWSHTTRLFRRVCEMLDPRIGRGMFNTYNARMPFFRWPLDHVFHTEEFRLVKLRRLKDVGSDHFPMEVTLQYVPNGTHPDKPQADVQEKREAEKRIKEGKQGE